MTINALHIKKEKKCAAYISTKFSTKFFFYFFHLVLVFLFFSSTSAFSLCSAFQFFWMCSAFSKCATYIYSGKKDMRAHFMDAVNCFKSVGTLLKWVH